MMTTRRFSILGRREFLAFTASTVLKAADPVMRPVVSESACPLGRITPIAQDGHSGLAFATTKRYKDAQQQWQEKTQWHDCVAYNGPLAESAAKIQTGDHVFLEGELVHREYERTVETDNGPVKVPWPVTEIVIGTISVIDRKQNREQKGAA